MCGDSTLKEDVENLMDGKKADILISSPPYNIGRTPNGNEKKYLNNSDNKLSNDYLTFLKSFTELALHFAIYSFINIQSVRGNKIALIEYLYHFKDSFSDYIIWDKMSAEPAMGENILNSRFEFIYCFNHEAKRRIGVSKFRGNLENIIFIKSRQKKEFSDLIKAVFPVQFAQYFIINFSMQSALDLFLGSGSTLIACEQTNRICYGMEIDPIYIDVILRRYHSLYPDKKIECLNRKFNFNKLFNA
jgi:DNA modification methylase